MNRREAVEGVRNMVRLKHLAYSTEKSYAHWVSRYSLFVSRRGAEGSSEQKVEAFLSSLAKAGVSASTQNQAFNAILFLYRDVLKQELKGINALRAKRPVFVRVAPPRPDVLKLLDAVADRGGYPLRLVVRLLYGCGLRLNEALDLRIKDVMVSQSRLIIRGAKGGKDRVVPLPCSLAAELMAQIEVARGSWMKDQQARMPVPLPSLLSVKYFRAPYEWRWYWLFPAHETCRHPRTREIVRWRIHPACVQRAVRTSARKIGLEGVTPHHLRHAYATHALEAGNSVRDVQEALGHAHLDTTMGYIHAEPLRVRSPLETVR
jgi:integron integrase